MATRRSGAALDASSETSAEASAQAADSEAVALEPSGQATDGWAPPAPPNAAPEDPLLDCLAMLTAVMERPTSRDALSAGLPLVDGRITPQLAPRAAERAGLSGRWRQRKLRAINTLTLPCILALENGEACLLLSIDGGRCRIALPDSGGEITTPMGALEEVYTGWAFFARPQIGFELRDKGIADERTGHWFWRVVLEQRAVYAQVLVAAVLINVFALAGPLFTMNVYDRVVPNNALDTLWVLAAGALTVFAFDFVLKTLRGYFVDSAGKVTDIKLASNIFQHVLGIKMAARPQSAGAFANNLREFESLRDFFASATVTTLVDVPFVFFFIAVIWMIGGPVAFVPLVAAPLVVIVGLLAQRPLDRVVRQTFKEAAQKHGILVETINGLEILKSVGAEGRMQRSWERFVTATAQSSMKARLISAATVNFAATATQAVTVGVVIVGVYQISAGEMTMGALVACSIIAGRAMAPLGQVAGLLTRMNQAKTSYDSLSGVMSLPVERDANARFLHRPNLRGEIELKNVVFSYPNQKTQALSGVSMKIRAGEKVALIGRVGSGKTTIEKLILGLYEPQEGSVLIDGADVRQIDPADLRRNIGCVPQDLFLFQGTLRDNIAMGAPHVDDAAVMRAAKIAGVDDFASRHPMGYDLPVGERGDLLSGGQRQAVAIARALLLDPSILVLDEPTSAMDNGAENRFRARLDKALPNRTLILVTHRASLLALVDRLVVMDGGKVVADGPKEKVLKALASGQIRGEN